MADARWPRCRRRSSDRSDRPQGGHRPELNTGKQALLAKQRAVVATLGAEWIPLRDELERDVLTAAGSGSPTHEYAGDHIEPLARSGSFRSEPGLYLRMRIVDASSPQTIRAIAADAKRDAFAACLLREANEPGLRGDADAGAFAEQPWNVGQIKREKERITGE